MLLDGQEKLSKTFEDMKIENLPQTILLLGEYGCGKHLLSTKIASKFNLEYLDITEYLTNDVLSELSIKPLPTLYVINASQISERQQNVILKFLEDYKPSSYVCLLVESKNLLLETICNRCVVYTFDRYSRDFIKEKAKEIVGDTNLEYAIELSNTVGQLKLCMGQDLVALRELCDKIIHKIKNANLSNALSIADKFNYSDLYDKFDVMLFFKIMIKELGELCIQDSKYLDLYLLTQRYAMMTNNQRVKKHDLIENYLIQLWR